MRISYIRHSLVDELHEDVEKNLDRYRDGNFDDLFSEERVKTMRTVSYDPAFPRLLVPASGGDNDARNSLLVYEALSGMTPYSARDERIWAWFTHGPCLEFARRRWLDGDGDAKQLAKDVRLHFFARGGRGITRNNAVSFLWWMAHIASRYERAELQETLKILLSNTDMRLNIIERPTAVRNQKVFSAILDIIRDPAVAGSEIFFKRTVYRKWLQKVNMHGGLRMLGALSESELKDLLERLAAEAVRDA